MTRRRGSLRATVAIPWKRYFSTSRAAPRMRPRDEWRDPRRCRRDHHVLARACCRDGAALLVPVALVLRAVDRTDLLADRADADVGLPADLSRRPVEHAGARGRRVHRRSTALGYPVPRPARVLGLVSRRDVRAQSRQPDDLAAAAFRVRRRA